MKELKYAIILAIIFLANPQFSFAQNIEAPYFLLENGKPGDMPLESNKAEVFISGIIADVQLEQTYINKSDAIIEAIYIFPGSSQSAVYIMEMQIGNRIIKAELKEKEEARKVYEEAKAEGKRTSLLEQHRPNVFQMNVANILPGEKILVRLKYTEKIIPLHGDYQFRLPTVVGPRYQSPQTQNHASFVNMPYTKEKLKPNYTYKISVFIQAGQEIRNIVSHTHKIDIKKLSARSASIKIGNEELFNGNKDFVVQYRLSDNNISTGLLLYEHEDENFFFANIQPPNLLADAQLPSREYIFILDISGSMFGFPLDVSKKLMKDLLSGLKTTDRFNVMLFAGTSYVFSDTSLYADKNNIDYVLNNIENVNGGGRTELLPALEKAINLPRTSDYLSRSLVVLTDGYISVEKEVFDLISQNLNNTNVFSFGIGSSTNHFLIEGLANAGQGLPFTVENTEVACDVAERFKNYISKPSLSNISIRFEDMEAYDIYPSSIPDLFSERPLNIMGKWKGNPNGKMIIEGKFAGSGYQQIIDFKDFAPDSQNSAIRLLWAREKIKVLDDYRKVLYDESHKREMIDLSLKYNLLSAYTSFVAVDYEKVNNGGILKLVKQALPMPEGVSNYAVGAELEIKKSMVKPKAMQKYLSLGDIEGIDDKVVLADFQKFVILKLYNLKKCLSGDWNKSLNITITFDEEGHLETVTFDQILDKKVKKCLINEVNSWDFESLNIAPMSDIIIPLVIK